MCHPLGDRYGSNGLAAAALETNAPARGTFSAHQLRLSGAGVACDGSESVRLWGELMRRPCRVFAFLLLLCLASVAIAQRQMEALGRGVVAVNQGGNRVYVSWRLLGTDPDELAFNVYRATATSISASVTAPVLLTPTPLTQTTDFVDTTADTSRALFYFVRPVLKGAEKDASAAFVLPPNAPVRSYLSIPLVPPSDGTTPDGVAYSYTANDCSVGDLDGDGEYEIVLKWDPTNSKDNSQSGYTGNVFLDAYKLDGTRLWRIDLGRNIRAGAHYTQFMVYDLDGDGRAEIACKTADGTVDGAGIVIGKASADFRNSAGYILSGPEYLTVFDGRTGAALATTNYVPARNSDPTSNDVSAWGDNYGNRVDRFLAGVAYLDGLHPSLIMCRGYYTRTALVAWDWRDHQLTQRWRFDTRSDASPRSPAAGYATWEDMGNHQLSIADVDEDGRDEIVYGALVIDDDGRGLYSTGRGHGDAFHVSDMDPDRPGLEVYGPHETPSLYGDYGSEMRDARTGAVIWGASGQGADVGRGVAFDIDPRYRGYEGWSARGGLYSAKGELITSSRPSQMNFGVWWDADPLREILDGTTISKWDWNTSRATTILDATGCSSNNSTKATPNLCADILGDWREEVIWRSSDNRELRIYTTTIPATNRLYTLMHDSQYRTAIAWQNVAYNQPPHPGFYLGDGMGRAPTPLIRTVSSGVDSGSHLINLSVLAPAGEGADTLIVGFAVAGADQRSILMRAIGPTLSTFGVADPIANPLLKLYAGTTLIGSNDDWAIPSADPIVAAADSVGAFPLPRDSADSALLSTLTPGGYSTHIDPHGATHGVAMVELYAAAGSARARLTNVSVRARIAGGSNAEPLIVGFVVGGEATRTVLIRAVGPQLAQYGVSGAMANPQLTLFRGTTPLARNDDWNRDSGATAGAFASFGAFPLANASPDAALLVNLPAGGYSVHTSPVDGASGVVLVEVYTVGE